MAPVLTLNFETLRGENYLWLSPTLILTEKNTRPEPLSDIPVLRAGDTSLNIDWKSVNSIPEI